MNTANIKFGQNLQPDHLHECYFSISLFKLKIFLSKFMRVQLKIFYSIKSSSQEFWEIRLGLGGLDSRLKKDNLFYPIYRWQLMF